MPLTAPGRVPDRTNEPCLLRLKPRRSAWLIAHSE